MGFLDFFKKRKNKVNKTAEIPYSNGYELKVNLFVSHPSIFDSEAIHKNLSKYFENYFKENPINEYEYYGMGLMFGPCIFKDECKVRIIFDEEVIEFLDDYELIEWKSNINELTGMPTESIKIVYMTGDDEIDEMMRKSEAIDEMDKLNAELEESNSIIQDFLNEMQEELEEKNKEMKVLNDFLRDNFQDDDY